MTSPSSTAAPGRAIAPDSGIVCELLERGVHAKFSLLKAGNQHLVAMQEVLQLCVAVENTIAMNCRNLPLSKAGPGSAVLIWAGGLLGAMEGD